MAGRQRAEAWRQEQEAERAHPQLHAESRANWRCSEAVTSPSPPSKTAPPYSLPPSSTSVGDQVFKGPALWGIFLIETNTVMVNQCEASLSDAGACLTQTALSGHPGLVGGWEVRMADLPWFSWDFLLFILTVLHPWKSPQPWKTPMA